jgi:hypothetical protein
MITARGLLVIGVVLLPACSGGSDAATEPAPSSVPPSAPQSADPEAAVPSSTTSSTPSTSSTTTTTSPPICTVTVAAGDSLRAIVDRVGDSVTLESLLEENWLLESDVIHPGDELDVCVGNDVDDVTGASRLPPGPEAVAAQQRTLNELFAPYSIADLLVDGVSGPLTRQLLCAARMGLDLRVSTADMSEDSPEEDALFAATSLSIPDGAATWASRWILVDETCQVVFIGEGSDRIVDVFPTSTGQPGFETQAAAYRYDPAVENDGWHDSASFPSEVDNPLNGNMYKPVYFNGGQAIHGANVVPPDPRSKGCARLYPWHQDALVAWLGLADVEEITWRKDQIAATVTVQGDYRPAPTA